ncbi:MAG: hypothetical protein VX498_00120, partial [Myxococcota bacterium]|nr:hypothetical protein [Myxococcota bacterium]
MRFSFPHAALIAAMAFTTACGPVRSTLGLIQADKALQEAREMQAAEHAPYPMTLAESLRKKAFEEQGYGAYDTAMNMAREAESLARAAIEVTRAATAPAPAVSPPADEAEGKAEDDPAASGSPDKEDASGAEGDLAPTGSEEPGAEEAAPSVD